MSTASTYTIYATIVDSYGGSSQSSSETVFSVSRVLNITSDGTGIALGKMAENTNMQFERVIARCRELFAKKLHDYGASWRIMRPESLTDQIFIKAKRIRNLETGAENMVGEGIVPEFIGIVNYGLISLVQLEKGYADDCDITPDEAMALYDIKAKETLELMKKKNHDYNEAWRGMRVTSYTDLILTKLWRTKQIEELGGATKVSEGIDANYMDMINYAVFALIKNGVAEQE